MYSGDEDYPFSAFPQCQPSRIPQSLPSIAAGSAVPANTPYAGHASITLRALANDRHASPCVDFVLGVLDDAKLLATEAVCHWLLHGCLRNYETISQLQRTPQYGKVPRYLPVLALLMFCICNIVSCEEQQPPAEGIHFPSHGKVSS